MSEKIIRTFAGSALQTAMLLGIDYPILDNTTLNQLLQIQQNALIPSGTFPRAQFYCIGNGGHKAVSGSDGFPYLENIPHDPKDTGLFRLFPFILRPITNDLTVLQRAKYALRRIETHNNLPHAAYYLKRLDMSGVTVDLQSRVIENGVTTTTDFVPSPASLTPTPAAFTNVGSNALTAEYLVAAALLSTAFTQDECTELLDAATIIYSDTNYAVISEMGLCAGVNKVITLPNNTNFTEAIGVQIVSHIARLHQIKTSPTGVSGTLELGTSEVLNTVN